MNGNLKDIERVLDFLGSKVPRMAFMVGQFVDKETDALRDFEFSDETEFLVSLPKWAWRIIKENHERNHRSEANEPQHGSNDSVHQHVDRQTEGSPVPRHHAGFNDT